MAPGKDSKPASSRSSPILYFLPGEGACVSFTSVWVKLFEKQEGSQPQQLRDFSSFLDANQSGFKLGLGTRRTLLLRVDDFLGINRGQMSRLTLDLPKSSDPIDNKAAVIWLQDLARDSIIIFKLLVPNEKLPRP